MQPERLAAACLVVLGALAGPRGSEPDYYRNLRYPARLRPDVGRDEVEQEGGPRASGYRRRTVRWWPRRGQDFVSAPPGAPLRVWTRNLGQRDREARAGLCRNWTASDPPAFRAHLVGLRGFAVPTPNPVFADEVMVPAAVLRLQSGEQRAVVDYEPFSRMLSREDHEFLLETWKAAWPRLKASLSREPYVTNPRDTLRFPADSPGCFVIESDHWRFQTGSRTWVDDFYLLCPREPEKQARFRKGTLEFAENLWALVEASGAAMPFWRESGPKYKFAVTTGPAIKDGREFLDPGNGGGYGCCTVYWCGGGPRNVKLSHEFFHSGYHGENGCNTGQHMVIPGELQMFSHNFCYPWRHVMFADYQAGLWMVALGDNPNWGCGIVPVLGSLRAAAEPTLFHVVARLGERKGLWRNGIKGLGDFFGEYAARMATIDLIEQPMLRPKYGMPEVSFLHAVHGKERTYRIPTSEAPRAYGFNIVRLLPDRSAREVTVDFLGQYEPRDHSDWRACLVAVDGKGRARYSPLWNRGEMSFRLRPSDAHLWLTVAATPSALPLREGAGWHGGMNTYFKGKHAPRFPWEATFSGCRPGAPHRRPGDVVNFDELYTINNTNFYADHAVKHEVPIAPWEKDASRAREKLEALLPRIASASAAVRERLEEGRGEDEYWLEDWYEHRKLERLEDLERRARFLLRNMRGHRHPNGGGFVAESARVAPTAYVGPGAMVLDGARVEENARIEEFAVVIGPRALVAGHARIAGKAWVSGDLRIDGDARILESVVVTTRDRFRGGYHIHSRLSEGRARITGHAVIKGEHILRLCYTRDQVLGGTLVVDYNAKISNRASGAFLHGRICDGGAYNWAYTPVAQRGRCLVDGFDAGGLYANWEFDQPKSRLLEDSYVNNNGVLHGGPEFASEGDRRFLELDGEGQYAEAPPSVADFGELTIDAELEWAGGGEAPLFDFGTAGDERFSLILSQGPGRSALVAAHGGRSFRLSLPGAFPSGRWVRVRVELDGEQARLYLDGERVARGEFSLRPRDVYGADCPEGNCIGCDLARSRFLEGRLDHFRIYRGVRDDFEALGEPPPPLTQVVTEEGLERAARFAERLAASERHTEWLRRRRAAQEELARKDPEQDRARQARELERRRSEILAEGDWVAERLGELEAIGRRLHDIQRERKSWCLDGQGVALQESGFSRDPFEVAREEGVASFQHGIRLHPEVDWDPRTPQEVRGEVPAAMKEWLERVRGD